MAYCENYKYVLCNSKFFLVICTLKLLPRLFVHAFNSLLVIVLSVKYFLRPALLATAPLLVPLVAMHFTSEVNWTPTDFVVAGLLFFSTSLAYKWLASRGGNVAYRLGAGVALGTALLLLWVNLAVGLIGSEHNSLNLLYAGVLATGVAGALLARFQPQGMARALGTTALAQVLVAGMALAVSPASLAANSVWGVDAFVLGANVLFVLLWVTAALLFWRAAGQALGK